VRPAGASGGEPLDQYRRLIESLTDYAIFALSPDGNISSWNSGAEKTFGYKASEVLGRNYSLIFTAKDVSTGRPQAELSASLIKGGESVDGWHVRKDGSSFWCTDTIQPVRGATGDVTGFTKIVRDSNERHFATERLRESEERLRSLIDGVTDYAIFSIDEAGTILLWNPGAEHIFGYTEDEVLGKNFSLIYTPDAISRGVPDAEITIATRDGHALDEGWHVRKGGDRFYASGQMTRLKPDVDGSARGFVKIAHDITARNEADETVKRKAFTDELTKLPNRAFFTDCLHRSIARAKRHPSELYAVIFVDLDRFKVLNDSLGHVTADRLLVYVARTLEGCVRPEDVVGRFGGDEFTILLSEIRDRSDVTRVASRIHAALQKPLNLDGLEIYTTVSMGIAVGSPAYEKPEQVLRDADTAMYEAKARGRSRHVIFDSEMHARAVGLLNLQMDLRRALARGEFVIAYQPIVSLEDSKVIGFEALVRWNHPDRGFLAPAAFIGEAENIGLIIGIDRWVLGEACRQIREWQVESGDYDLTVSVNLSGKQFAHESLVDEIRDALERNSLTSRSLKLEITETVLMEQSETTSRIVTEIGELGVELYIDDFGTGYSSLSYLTRLPLKLLKVDRSFVSQISLSERSVEVARTIVTLAHNLGVKALAEGIETEEQLEKLEALGCEFGQGYWFSPPVPADAAKQLIGRCLPV
jgi:diguanylate cyclase (GGDEF)-like protein/PAS domain S-box-containing protein